VIDLEPDERAFEDLQTISWLLSSRRIDETGGMTQLQASELRKAWLRLRSGY